MSVVASLLALLLAGTEGPSAKKVEGISYQLRVVEMNDVQWRETLYFRLKPVGRQGTSPIWTTDHDTAKALEGLAGQVVWAPKVTAEVGSSAWVCIGPFLRSYVAEVGGEARGPMQRVTSLNYCDRASVPEKFQASLKGRFTDQGVELQMACEASWVAAMHKVDLPRMYVDKAGAQGSSLKAAVEVPETASAKVDGKWFVPNEGVLVVSLGVHSSVDREKLLKGEKAADAVRVCERLLLVDVNVLKEGDTDGPPPASAPRPVALHVQPMPTTVTVQTVQYIPVPVFVPVPNAGSHNTARTAAAPAPLGFMIRMAPGTAPLAPIASPDAAPPAPLAPASIPMPTPIPMPMPTPPSRSLPLAGGSSVLEPLPPLPDEDVQPASLTTSSVVRPSPQSPHVARQGTADPGTVRTSATRPTEGAACCTVDTACVNKTAKDEVWNLTLAEAIRLGLDNSEAVRVVEVRVCGLGSQAFPDLNPGQPLTIAPLNRDWPEWRFRASVMQLVRSIEQQYWALSQQQAQIACREKALALGNEGLKRELAELEVCRGTTADVAEARQRLENFRLQLFTATSDLITTERQLRNLLGLQPIDNRRIVAVSTPSEARQSFDWDTCLAQMMTCQPDVVSARELMRKAAGTPSPLGLAVMRVIALPPLPASALATRPDSLSPVPARQQGSYEQVVHQTTHSLARCFLEVDANDKQIQVAKQLCVAATKRLDEQRAEYEVGRITLDRYLGAVSAWSDAVVQEAQFKTSYNVSIIALEEVKGTLLDDEGIVVATHPEPVRKPAAATTWHSVGTIPVDPSMVKASFAAPQGKDSRTEVAPEPLVGRSETIRIPLGGNVAIEIRATVKPRARN